MLVGAYALTHHGAPGAIGGIDFFIRSMITSSHGTWRALAEFCAPLAGLGPDYVATPGNNCQIGVPPARINILTQISGLRYEDARTDQTTLFDLPAQMISKADYIADSKASGRPKDLADIDAIQNSV